MRAGNLARHQRGGVPSVGPGRGGKPLTGVDGPMDGWMDGPRGLESFIFKVVLLSLPGTPCGMLVYPSFQFDITMVFCGNYCHSIVKSVCLKLLDITYIPLHSTYGKWNKAREFITSEICCAMFLFFVFLYGWSYDTKCFAGIPWKKMKTSDKIRCLFDNISMIMKKMELVLE